MAIILIAVASVFISSAGGVRHSRSSASEAGCGSELEATCASLPTLTGMSKQSICAENMADCQACDFCQSTKKKKGQRSYGPILSLTANGVNTTLLTRWPMLPQGSLSDERQGESVMLYKGFQNAGNSCFMATALQILLHSADLIHFVTGGGVAGNIWQDLDESDPNYRDANACAMNFASRRKLLILLRDLKEIYERYRGNRIDRVVTQAVRAALVEVGLAVDGMGTQENAADVLFKILEAFPFANVPGFAQQVTQSKVENCIPGTNPLVQRIDPGIPRDQLGDWVRNRNTCTNRNVGRSPESAASPSVPPRSRLTIRELLRSEEVVGNSAQEARKLYDRRIKWTKCNYNLQLARNRERFNPMMPKAERYCDPARTDKGPPISAEVRKVHASGENLALYGYTKVSQYVIPRDSNSFMISPKIYDARGNFHAELNIPASGEITLPVDGREETFQLSACALKIGDARGGHWKAAVRHPVDGQWWDMDDAHAGKYPQREAVRRCTSQSPFLVFTRSIPVARIATSQDASGVTVPPAEHVVTYGYQPLPSGPEDIPPPSYAEAVRNGNRGGRTGGYGGYDTVPVDDNETTPLLQGQDQDWSDWTPDWESAFPSLLEESTASESVALDSRGSSARAKFTIAGAM